MTLIPTTPPNHQLRPSEEMDRREGWPYACEPTGWFQLAWSEEVGPNGVLAAEAFGHQLVACRGEAGDLRVYDAYCPHLGAHLGVGGVMRGDRLACPFHGWEFDAEGRNACIPYSTKVMPNLTLKSWPVREIDGLIVVWHDAAGGEPAWEPLPIDHWVKEFDSSDYFPLFPAGVHLWPSVRLHPQLVVENIVDSAHFQFVHAAAHGSVIIDYGADGHIFRCSQRFDGRKPAQLDMWAFGLGLMLGAFSVDGELTHLEIQATTPLLGQRSALRGSVWVRQDPASPGTMTDRMNALIELQHDQLNNDIPIWENMRYRANAPMAPEEAPAFRALRKWAAQFYPVGEAS
ncbi:Rieske 2Fe-2S domain-containing protein [Sporichthya brevicatena]|uniref:cholesterol 7-desaturase n=2 Tax=Sporichthya brevicatena TaxID=171442 RepID=A0ABP3SIQ7_9ACTN